MPSELNSSRTLRLTPGGESHRLHGPPWRTNRCVVPSPSVSSTIWPPAWSAEFRNEDTLTSALRSRSRKDPALDASPTSPSSPASASATDRLQPAPRPSSILLVVALSYE